MNQSTRDLKIIFAALILTFVSSQNGGIRTMVPVFIIYFSNNPGKHLLRYRSKKKKHLHLQNIYAAR